MGFACDNDKENHMLKGNHYESPRIFSQSKPMSTLTIKDEIKVHTAGQPVISRKYGGEKYVLIKNPGYISVFSPLIITILAERPEPNRLGLPSARYN